jgi:DNA-binding SARP family transcriptional activator
MLSVILFGPPALRDGAHAVELPRRKSRALVFYLAAQPGPVPRERLLALLWPEHERDTARQNLRTTLHGLRRALGAALVGDSETLALVPEVEVDARRFSAGLARPAASAGELAAMLDLFRGEFLEGFHLPDSPTFDSWADGERQQYRQLAVRGLTLLARRHEAQGAPAAALDALARALAFDPLQEDLQRAAMRLHYLAGDRAGAIRRYERLRQLLDDELGVPPMAETQALYDAIITDRMTVDDGCTTEGGGAWDLGRAGATGIPVAPAFSSPALPPSRSVNPGELPLVGRTAELAALRGLAGAGRLGLLEGEPGIGKTRLLAEFAHTFDGIAVGGAARELERALPYQPLIEALRALAVHPAWPAVRARLELAPVWTAEVARLAPELFTAAPVPGPPDEPRLWEGVTRLLLAVARLRPLALTLDDLHWADAATLALLGYLARRAGEAPLALAAAARPVESRAPLATLLQALTHEGRLLRMALGRLAPQEAAALVGSLSPAAGAALADWLVRHAEGNPFILAELVRCVHEGRAILPADGDAAPVVPPSVYSLIQSRLAPLSEGARRVLDAAVAAGREFEFEVVARAAALSDMAALDALDELRAAGLVVPAGGMRFAFDHSVTMEVAYREVGEPRHRLMHRRLAEALESLYAGRTDEVAGLIASHFAEGNVPERAAPYAFRAGQIAAGLAAWHEAIGFYEQALAAAPGRRAAIHLALGEAFSRLGDTARAAEHFRAAVREHEASDDPDADIARLRLAEALIEQARFAEVIELAQPLSRSPRPEVRFHAEFVWGAALSLEGADLAGAAEHLRAAAALCALHPDPAARARVAFELGNLAAQQGDLPAAVACYREALAAAEAAPRAAAPWRILAHNNLAYHLLLLGDPHAGAHAAAGMRLAQDEGALNLQPYLYSTQGEVALAAGDLAGAERLFQEGLALAERLTIPERIAGLTANLGLVAARRGEVVLSVYRLSTALARANALGTQHLAAQIRVWLAPLLPPDEARARLAEARAIAERGGRRRLLAEIAEVEALWRGEEPRAHVS